MRNQTSWTALKKPSEPLLCVARSSGVLDGAGTVVDFIPRGKSISIPRPSNTSEADALFSHSVCGDSLYNPIDRDKSVGNGDTLICKANFEVWEVKPEKICIVFIAPTCERLAKKIIVEGDRVLLRSPNPFYADRNFHINDIEVKGIAVGFVRNF